MTGPQAASQKKARVTAIAFRILGKLIHVNQSVLENFRLPPASEVRQVGFRAAIQ